MKIYFPVPNIFLLTLIVFCSFSEWEIIEKNGYHQDHQSDGLFLGYSADSGVTILGNQGYAFRDLNQNGIVDPCEDGRLPIEKRIVDLAGRMTNKQVAGLMLYSVYRAIPSTGGGFCESATYSGMPYSDSGSEPWELSDQQKISLNDNNVLHVQS